MVAVSLAARERPLLGQLAGEGGLGAAAAAWTAVVTLGARTTVASTVAAAVPTALAGLIIVMVSVVLRCPGACPGPFVSKRIAVHIVFPLGCL